VEFLVVCFTTLYKGELFQFFEEYHFNVAGGGYS